MASFHTIWHFALDILFPAFCIGCRTEGEFLCENCFKKIEILERQECPICYIQNENGITCEKCIDIPENFLDGLFVACSYKESSLLNHCIHAFKYDFVKELSGALGRLLISTIKKYVEPDAKVRQPSLILCPIPLHKRRLKWRGFNQSEILAMEINMKLDLPVKNLLIRTHFKRPQMELSREDRLKNIMDAFKIVPDMAENCNTVLLIDDVATTLATMQSCAQELKKNGIKKVFGIVLARVN